MTTAGILDRITTALDKAGIEYFSDTLRSGSANWDWQWSGKPQGGPLIQRTKMAERKRSRAALSFRPRVQEIQDSHGKAPTISLAICAVLAGSYHGACTRWLCLRNPCSS